MGGRALVLGGGGPVGVAWEIGLLAGLQEKGVDLSNADRIVGTSAGSFVGAQIASGRSAISLLEAQRELVARESAPKPASNAPAQPAPDLTPLMGFMAEQPKTEEERIALHRKIGAFALNAKTIPEEAFIGGFGHIASGKEPWPSRYACTAVDAVEGHFVVWDAASGIDLGRGIASSCSVPGIYPAITINGRRYIDGGMRSATNFDLAKGYDKVVAVAVMSRAATDVLRAKINPEIAALTEAGAAVELIVPSEPCLDAFGPNLMDPSRRAAIIEAAVAQGQAEADRIGGFWA